MSEVRPREAADYSPAELAAAALDMDRVLAREPHDFGFGTYERNKTPEERASNLRLNRERIREPRSLAGARGWLRQVAGRLKHWAKDDVGYTTNGVFIAAAIAEGFTVRRTDPGSPNAFFNISTEAWRRAPRATATRVLATT